MNDSPPVRKSEERFAARNPEGTYAPLEALRTVILWTFTDAFGLVTEETMWAGYHLDQILAPLMDKKPRQVTLAVRQEMHDGTYTRALAAIEARDDRTGGVVYDPEAAKASVNDWAAVVLQMVTECYQIRPMEESAMHGQIVGLLRDLGIDHPQNPRAARYLPNDVLYRLRRK